MIAGFNRRASTKEFQISYWKCIRDVSAAVNHDEATIRNILKGMTKSTRSAYVKNPESLVTDINNGTVAVSKVPTQKKMLFRLKKFTALNQPATTVSLDSNQNLFDLESAIDKFLTYDFNKSITEELYRLRRLVAVNILKA